MIGSQKQICCPNCGIGHCDGPPWEVIVFCPLHAAAPELLAALEAIVEWLCDNGPVVDDGITHPLFVKANNLAHAAITKATSPQAPPPAEAGAR
mgnify:CR=1 FL=1